MTEAEIITEFRDIYGMSVTEYSDTYLSALIEKARKKISEFYPENEMSYFTTVLDQTRYTITQDNLFRVKAVYYGSANADPGLFNDPDIQDNCNNQASTYDLSRGFEMIARLKALRELYPQEGEIISHNKVNLLPTPSKTGDRVYYEYERYRTLAEIPDCFLEDFISLGMFYIKDKFFKQKSNLQGGNVYNFDRRGNIQDTDTSTVSTEKIHMESFNIIIDNIKAKVMKL